jgi:hypothetical protein
VSLLARWRATGADLPFGDPERFHGAPLEGWYWRFAQPERDLAVAVVCGVLHGTWAEVVIAVHPHGIVREVRVPWPPTGTFARAGATLGAEVADVRVDVALDPGPPLRAALWPALGPAHLLPRFPQYWAPLAAGTVREGRVTIDGTEHDLAGARAYGEKSWGPHFPPDGWWWGAAHAFDDPALVVAFAGGPLLHGLAFAPTAIVARVRAGLVRLGSPPLWPVRTVVGDGEWHVEGRGARTRVRIDGQSDGGHLLLPHPEPDDGTFDRRAEHWLDGVVEAVVEGRRGGRWRTLGAGRSPLAGLERGRPRAATVAAEPAVEGTGA